MFSLVTLIASAAFATGSAPKNGEELVREMRARYSGKWYTTLTFVQKTTFPNGNIETWYEALKLPGELRIDIAPLDSGKAIIFRNDTIYQLNGGKVRVNQPLIHPLMVLGFDVYLDPAEMTISKLKALSFDLSKLHAGTWQGRPVYVVGAEPEDSRTPQFWIDQETLLFVRMLRPVANGVIQETQFNKYVQLGGGWIAPEVLFFNDGKPGLIEEYRDWKIGMTFQPDLFDPAKLPKAEWIGR